VRKMNLVFGIGLLAAVACGGDTPAPAKQAEVPAKEAPAAAKEEAAPAKEEVAEEVVEKGPTPAPTDDYKGPIQEIILESDGDQMKWKTDRIEVVEGQRVKIIVKNNATTASMKHNLLIVNKGAGQAVGMAGAQASANHFIPNHKDVLFATTLTEPGETVELIFDPPAAGEYEFLCSYIGHFMMMKGVFVVKAAS